MKIEAKTVAELPDLGEAHKGSSAVIGKGFMREMWIYVWHVNEREGTAYGEWKFACYPSNANMRLS